MALKSTIHRLELDVADIDHDNYGSFSLTLARHPSETEERLMMRVLAFALHADPALESLPESQKLLIRMGPRNRAIIVAQLQRLREALGS